MVIRKIRLRSIQLLPDPADFHGLHFKPPLRLPLAAEHLPGFLDAGKQLVEWLGFHQGE
ncbi:MAG: hypothetical protein NW241_10775 [Bacteroidia bacterium]|nr:hypothetical protein [Bacteroidia bacterium]